MAFNNSFYNERLPTNLKLYLNQVNRFKVKKFGWADMNKYHTSACAK